MRTTRADIAGRILLVLAILALLVPVYWLVKSAFSDQNGLFADPPQFVPTPPTVQGFADILPTLGPSLGVSAIIALGCVVLTLVIAMPTAYGLSLLAGGRGSGASRFVVLSTLMFPSIMFVIPLYNLFYVTGILNTVGALIIADSIYAVPLGIVVCYTYFTTIPSEITEAAVVDGASPARVFLRIIVPLGMPAIATTAIFAFLFGWGDFLFAVTFGAGRGLAPASIAVAGLIQGTSGVTPWPSVMAGAVVLCIPALVAVLFAQRFITGGLSAGAVK
jgi:multiple sugar transport system permease protein